MTTEDQSLLAVASHFIRNKNLTNIRLEGTPVLKEDDVLYVSLKKDDKDYDFKVEKLDG